MVKGKASVPVYVYLKKGKKVNRTVPFPVGDGVFLDVSNDNEIIGYEFLDCVGVEINGKPQKL